ncbi:hypothetical protein [Roseovarius atlanticus]|uniref:hypothetical protein n=1 Tax=Roseovarius atlanticus TaxID=1641875 RepID=UPI001C96DCB0|nr:hypothetical protein [Roseovarius atlanticus]MBY5989608.1 hypothetical protein [Roseovarius atlanticus]MBY6126153.1 hypothetical protein [Roseovarius atlanticus]MBY6150647.1 hypothetical protein [Roseovarius atlanticus]
MSEPKRIDFGLSLFVKSLPLVSAFGIVLAFIYEAGFSITLQLSMHELLDVSDLFKTSIFTIPFIALTLTFALIMHFTEAYRDGKYDVSNLPDTTLFDRLALTFFVTLGIADFLHALLLGSLGGLRLWQMVLTLFVSVTISRLQMLEDHLPPFYRILVFSFVFLAIASYWFGRSDAKAALDPEYSKSPVVQIGATEWTVVRKYSYHMAVFDGNETLALASLSGTLIFEWPYKKGGWRGFLCEYPPEDVLNSTNLATFDVSRCKFPWGRKQTQPAG